MADSTDVKTENVKGKTTLMPSCAHMHINSCRRRDCNINVKCNIVNMRNFALMEKQNITFNVSFVWLSNTLYTAAPHMGDNRCTMHIAHVPYK